MILPCFFFLTPHHNYNKGELVKKCQINDREKNLKLGIETVSYLRAMKIKTTLVIDPKTSEINDDKGNNVVSGLSSGKAKCIRQPIKRK